MTNVERFRDQAARAFQAGQDTKIPEQKNTWESIANAYRLLAESVEADQAAAGAQRDAE